MLPKRFIAPALAAASAALAVLALAAGAGGEPARGGLDADSARLELRVFPWAHVEIDGESMPPTPWSETIELPPGTHEVRLSHPTIGRAQLEIELAPLERAQLEIDLERTVRGDRP